METLKAEMSVGVLHDHFLDALATTNCDLMTKGWRRHSTLTAFLRPPSPLRSLMPRLRALIGSAVRRLIARWSPAACCCCCCCRAGRTSVARGAVAVDNGARFSVCAAPITDAIRALFPFVCFVNKSYSKPATCHGQSFGYSRLDQWRPPAPTLLVWPYGAKLKSPKPCA
uniref:Uncharacterized protein n=2 Tax=Plectus sambesii TaxID=2011161 RepID=A0A914X1A7_9BILA